jgi:hypothetical protein
MKIRAFLTGFALGAAFMYTLDPDRGRRRRALANDQVVRLGNEARFLQRRATNTSRWFTERTRGLVHEARARFTEGAIPDELLVQRVRAKLGRVVSHPRTLVITANEGRVTVTGPILTHEIERTLAAIRAVRGVREVESRLESHATADRIAALQG